MHLHMISRSSAYVLHSMRYSAMQSFGAQYLERNHADSSTLGRLDACEDSPESTCFGAWAFDSPSPDRLPLKPQSLGTRTEMQTMYLFGDTSRITRPQT